MLVIDKKKWCQMSIVASNENLWNFPNSTVVKNIVKFFVYTCNVTIPSNISLEVKDGTYFL